MAKIRFAPFDAAEYLDNEGVIEEYLAAALEDPDPEAFMIAVSNVAGALGRNFVGGQKLCEAVRNERERSF
jgi:DNA-binding phage protein